MDNGVLSEIESYINDVLNGKSVKQKPDFYIVCPCCKSQNDKLLPSSINIVGNPSNGNEKRPFDTSPLGGTFFDEVRNNQNSLTPAYKLYQGDKKAYEDIHNNHQNRAYFLSLAWGIVRSGFGFPRYDVSFSRRQKYKNPKVYVGIDSNGEYTDNAWKKGMQNAFNHLKDDINKFGNHNIPIVLMIGKEYFLRFKYLYINSNMQNPVIVITASGRVDKICKMINWKSKKLNEVRTWYYKYMKII